MAEDADDKLKTIVEGLLLAAGRPLSLDAIARVFADAERPERKRLKAALDAIADDCRGRGFELKEVATGWRFQVRRELSGWVAKLWEERPSRYTRALLETLALIAYRQPITRGEIEAIRGVGVSTSIVRTLLDREWVRVVGRRDVPGRPALLATTPQFLDHFNMKSLEELPPLAKVKGLEEPGEPEPDLAEELSRQRIVDLPPEDADGERWSEDELLDEDEAVELSRRPLDEILGTGEPDDPEDLEGPEDSEGSEDSEESEEPERDGRTPPD